MVAALKSTIAQYCGKRANSVQIMITETNSVSYNPGKQTTGLVNALHLDEAVMTWLENGVANVDWWGIHNSPFDGNVDPSLYGSYNFGDYGLLSSGFTSSNGATEPPANTPFPAYYGLQVLSYLGDAWDTMLSTTSSTSLLSAHAIKQLYGNINVMLINKDPQASLAVNVSPAGTKVRGLAHVFTYGTTNASITRNRIPVAGSTFSITVQPYSVTTVRLP